MSNNDVRIVLVAKHGKNQGFENLLKEVFPSEIPVDMIDSIIIEFKDGNNAKLDHRELSDPLPTSPEKTWATMISAFSNVKQINIIVDVRKVEKTVGNNVADTLGKHFE
jgi:hypothetical protein